MTDVRAPEAPEHLTRLSSSLHQAQARGVLRDPEAIRNLLVGIAGALTRTVEGNALEPDAAWALQSDTYWEHFEMDVKAALLQAFAGLDPALYAAVRQVIDTTLADLKRAYRYS